MRTVKAPPSLRTFSQFPRGPQAYKYSLELDVRGGPGEPPPGFLTATNSVTEWIFYWACFKGLDIGSNPRTSGPPFVGVPGYFTYQTPMQGGRSLPGGAVPDFVIERTRTGIPVIVRIVTEFFHLFTSNAKQVSDAFQRQRLQDEADVVDVFDYEITGDPSGENAVLVVKRAAALIERPDPLSAGTARRNAR